jgi:hypothetical protein
LRESPSRMGYSACFRKSTNPEGRAGFIAGDAEAIERARIMPLQNVACMPERPVSLNACRSYKERRIWDTAPVRQQHQGWGYGRLFVIHLTLVAVKNKGTQTPTSMHTDHEEQTTDAQRQALAGLRVRTKRSNVKRE